MLACVLTLPLLFLSSSSSSSSPSALLSQYNRRTDYVALFSSLVFVTFYLSILYLQRSAEAGEGRGQPGPYTRQSTSLQLNLA